MYPLLHSRSKIKSTYYISQIYTMRVVAIYILKEKKLVHLRSVLLTFYDISHYITVKLRSILSKIQIYLKDCSHFRVFSFMKLSFSFYQKKLKCSFSSEKTALVLTIFHFPYYNSKIKQKLVLQFLDCRCCQEKSNLYENIVFQTAGTFFV